MGHADGRMTEHYSNVGIEEKRSASTAVFQAVHGQLAADVAADDAASPATMEPNP